MSKYVDVEKLRAEIERRMNILDLDSPFGIGGRVELELVLDIIASLQQEQPEVDFEKEIAENLGNVWNDTPVEVKQDMIKYARYFYELGKNSK